MLPGRNEHVCSEVAMYPGVSSICVSPSFRLIFAEIRRIASVFPHLNIDLIDENDQTARLAFMQYIADRFSVSLAAGRKKLYPEDFFRAIGDKEKQLSTAKLLQEKQVENLDLESRLEQLRRQQIEKIELEHMEREESVRRENEDALLNIIHIC